MVHACFLWRLCFFRTGRGWKSILWWRWGQVDIVPQLVSRSAGQVFVWYRLCGWSGTEVGAWLLAVWRLWMLRFWQPVGMRGHLLSSCWVGCLRHGTSCWTKMNSPSSMTPLASCYPWWEGATASIGWTITSIVDHSVMRLATVALWLVPWQKGWCWNRRRIVITGAAQVYVR